MPFAVTQMNLETIIQSEISQREKDKYHIMISLYMWNLKWDINELIYKRKRVTDVENRLVAAKDRGVRRELGTSRCKILYTECINSKVLLYSTGNYTRYPGINHDGKGYEKECTYMYK